MKIISEPYSHGRDDLNIREDKIPDKVIQYACRCEITFVGDNEYYRNKKCSLHENMSNEKFWDFFIREKLEK